MDALTQALNQFKTKISSLPQQFGALPEAIGQGLSNLQQNTRPFTLPVIQAVTGVQQRLNAPFLSSPITPLERQVDAANWEKMQNPQVTPADAVAENLGNYGWESHPSAIPQWHTLPEPVSTSPGMDAIKSQALQAFTPGARFQLSAVPVGVQPPQVQDLGLSMGGGGNRTIDLMPQRHNPNEVMTHEFLHAATRGIGGINTSQFLQDLVNTQHTLPPQIQGSLVNFQKLYPQMNGEDPQSYNKRLGEEMFAQTGALLGPNVLQYPALARYYTGIFNQPQNVAGATKLERKVR